MPAAETLLFRHLFNHQCLIATKANRIVIPAAAARSWSSVPCRAQGYMTPPTSAHASYIVAAAAPPPASWPRVTSASRPPARWPTAGCRCSWTEYDAFKKCRDVPRRLRKAAGGHLQRGVPDAIKVFDEVPEAMASARRASASTPAILPTCPRKARKMLDDRLPTARSARPTLMSTSIRDLIPQGALRGQLRHREHITAKSDLCSGGVYKLAAVRGRRQLGYTRR